MLFIVRYKNGVVSSEWLAECVKNGPCSVEFTLLVEWVTTELAAFSSLDDHVSAIKG
jgi:hypothetical protein